jgi:hypothetical protein
MRKRWRHNARQSGEGGLIDELLRNVMATSLWQAERAAVDCEPEVGMGLIETIEKETKLDFRPFAVSTHTEAWSRHDGHAGSTGWMTF